MSTAQKIKFPLYTLKQGSNVHVTMITKLDKEFGPVESYYVTEDIVTRKPECTCPSPYIPCKHAQLLRQARVLEPNNYQALYWHVAPKAAGIYQYTADEVGINV